MNGTKYDYVIIGGGLAGASAAEGIREVDTKGSVLLIGSEPRLPYHRPPLTKGLWSGKKKLEDIFVRNEDFYTGQNIDVRHGVKAISLDPTAKSVTDGDGREYRFGKLLLATGGVPNRLRIPGGDLEGVIYYRFLDDYLNLSPLVKEGKSVVVIGGGFIGTEIAAALCQRNLNVTMVFPETYPCSRIFPGSVGIHVLEEYRHRGITVLTGDAPSEIEKRNISFLVKTNRGQTLDTDFVIAGIGITPSAELAQAAGLAVGDGITVNSFLQTSHPDIYAAGDNAQFTEQQFMTAVRVEHWDNALNQGKCAGRNMAGAREPYAYMSYFFSDLFDFGYEAVGRIDSRLETHADWQKENEKGIVYYLMDGVIHGMLMCNVWGKVDAARISIQNNVSRAQADLREAV
jgi:NADPH-dependent 2,4-dienoyl-CoA reductase/sulfur reductase-like enzyme